MRFFLLIAIFFTVEACNNQSANSVKTSQQIKAQEEGCIQSIIKADESLALTRNNACKKISLTQTITDYVNGINKLDFSQCPGEFTSAFNNHKTAWVAMLVVTDKYPSMRGEMHELFSQLEQTQDSTEYKKYLKQITDTWTAVQAVMSIK